MQKLLIKKLLISKDSFSIQDKHDDYNSGPNSSILQDSCIIIIIIIIIIFYDVIFKFYNEHPEKKKILDHSVTYKHLDILLFAKQVTTTII